MRGPLCKEGGDRSQREGAEGRAPQIVYDLAFYENSRVEGSSDLEDSDRSRNEYGPALPGGEAGESGSRQSHYPQQSGWDNHHSDGDIESNPGSIDNQSLKIINCKLEN